MGVATIYKQASFLIICILFLFIISCNPINLPKQTKEIKNEDERVEKEQITPKKNPTSQITEIDKSKNIELDVEIPKNISVLIDNNDNQDFNNQLLNILELAIYNKGFNDVSFEIHFFNDDKELNQIITDTQNRGKIYIGPIESKNTSKVKTFCDNQLLFFSFSSDVSLAKDCIYLINFFPQNELEELFNYLEKDSRVALLYPENDYGYMINSIIDNIADKSNSVIINRSSYKQDLSNVRDAIKELGRYELRKYELERQKKILSVKTDNQSKKRLKKLEKFKTTTDYDFTHILIADYGINLLQVAPLLPFYDIDPDIVQFLTTGVIDNEIFFLEPSLQGAIFPGIEKSKREDLIKEYKEIYNENMMRVSTLPYDLIGLLNFIFSNEITHLELINLLNNSNINFEGIDGEFYFKNNIIVRNLDILKIFDGKAKEIN